MSVQDQMKNDDGLNLSVMDRCDDALRITEDRHQWHRLMFWAAPFLLDDNDDMPTSERHQWLLVSFDSENEVINDG